MTREEAIKVAYGIPVTKAQHEALQFLIPELADSDDERIRKDIINLIYWLAGNPSLCSRYYRDRYDGMLAWLEKQKEHKPADLSEMMVHKEPYIAPVPTPMVADEQKAAEFDLWKDTKKELPKPDSLILVQDFDVIRSLYYEGDGYLDKADGIKLSIYQKWCYQSDVKKIKPTEWSEEEYGRLFDIEHYLDGTLQLSPDRRIACIDFLKSLRSQSHWKPSEHQMTILKNVKDYVGKGSGYWGETLGSLIDDLEKL